MVNGTTGETSPRSGEDAPISPQRNDDPKATTGSVGGGALCNDLSGLCLGARGEIETSKSGVYTSIARLASQLDSGREGGDVPLITIQTNRSALLIKEYYGHAVVLRVPTDAEAEGDISEEKHDNIVAQQDSSAAES
uniref:Late endosomal/lysosomal adaptor and MAPK and MTOR activator 5 n=1 Tax=Ditylum brightwellii TaxID=49249 RepID=A0A6S9CT86_9STRA|mmetsp:Transcript_6961/g.9253  ORF Transcript_6961/g.9253 Transcript_6961/m.9253 type:complete len:137 (-) Transcript_6961:440-850(-)